VSKRSLVRRYVAAGVTAVMLVACSSEASPSTSSDGAAGTSSPDSTSSDTTATQPVGADGVVVAFDQGLGDGWNDYGWAAEVPERGPALVDIGEYGGWIVAHPGLTGMYDELQMSVRTQSDIGREFLDVRLGDESGSDFGSVSPTFEADGDLLVASVRISEMLGRGASFDRIAMQAADEYPIGTIVEVHSVRLVEGDPDADREVSTENASASVDCAAETRPISPHIYGTAFSASRDEESPGQWDLGQGSRRFGGNPTSRYNWKSGGFWNTAADYYWRNVDVSEDGTTVHDQFLEGNWANGAGSAVTVPMIGWVAKDDSSYSFPVGQFGEQEDIDPDNPDIGNGNSPDGEPLDPPPPSATSIEASPEFVAEWVRSMQDTARSKGEDPPFMYFLDNEPDLWDSTHRDVHPEPVTYDELLERSVAYGEAVREAAPDALIAGPTSWGWPGYFYSAADAAEGFDNPVDRRKHDNVPLIEWYLQQMKAYEDRTGTRLLDVLDVHFYPQNGSYTGGSDPETAALRIRSTRALWDEAYTDESWIEERVELIPRMQKWVDENYPGTLLSLGEYNFGGEGDMSGAIAQAEALGRFGQNGLFAAYYWTFPEIGSPVYWAFRAFGNYDEGSRFGDQSIPTEADRPLSVFASTNEAGEHVLVVLNSSDDADLTTTIDMTGCGVDTVSSLVYTGSPDGFAPGEATMDGETVNLSLPAYSITVVELP
jgi:hypothetical protein